MASPALLALLLFVAVLVPAQQVQLINYDALPGCAQGCTTLKTAQDGCVPPQAGVSTQQTYVSCFCQSAFLVNLKTTAQGLCDAACPSTSDQDAIKDWYNQYCSSGGTEGAAGASSTNPSASTTAAAAANSVTPSSTSRAKDQSNSQDVVGDRNKSGYEGSWLSAHWRWIIMLVVIFTGLSLITLVGICLKRRARARHDARQANVAAPEAAFSAPLPPAAPPMAHVHHVKDDGGTMTSTIDFGSTSSITAAPGSTSNSSVGNIAHSFLGRSRTPSNPLGRFPSTSQNNHVQPVPSPHNAWGPHHHQAATGGYEYPTYIDRDRDRRVPSPADASFVTGSTAVSSLGGSPNASRPHVAGVPPQGHGPSPLGNGTPRRTPSRGELANKATPTPTPTPPPLIAWAGHTAHAQDPATPPSAGFVSRPQVPRLNTAVGAGGSAKTPPPQQHQQVRAPTSPPRHQPTGIASPATAANASSGGGGARRDHLERTRSQEYGAEARYHNAGWKTGGMSASGSRKEKKKKKEEEEEPVAGMRGGWTSSRENLRAETQGRNRSRGGALVAGDEEQQEQGKGQGEAGDALARDGGMGGRKTVTSPLSADNAREKLRSKLSRQGSGFFSEGER